MAAPSSDDDAAPDARHAPAVTVRSVRVLPQFADEAQTTRIRAYEHDWVGLGSALGLDVDARLRDEFGVDGRMLQVMGLSAKYAILVGLRTLKDAGLIDADGGWALAPSERDATGVIFATSFACHEQAVQQVLASRADGAAAPGKDKFALQLTLNANTQLAQLVQARGLNLCISNTCASATSALKVAHNALRVGDARRMLVVSADTPLSNNLNESLLRSFVKMGEASAAQRFDDAVLPFSRGRNGFVFGEAAVGMLLELAAPGDAGAAATPPAAPSPPRQVQLLASSVQNSAYHGTNIDAAHVERCLARCLDEVRRRRPALTVAAFARRAVYFSHETFTATCARREAEALRGAFGEHVGLLRVTNTKCEHGHTMGAGVEDSAAVEALRAQRVPVVPVTDRDPAFDGLRLVTDAGDATEPFDYAIHVALGLGSHVAIVVYGV